MPLRARLQRQLNKKDKGASLVTVLLVSSIVAILVTAVLAIVILNVYMKKADIQGQGAFYDAESALEEVRAGLSVDISDATTVAYLDTLTNYSSLEDEAEKTDNFNREFLKEIRDRIRVDDGYDVNRLTSYLKETKLDENGVGAEISAGPDAAYNETELGAVLKDVVVKYTDKDGYLSEIKTDIVLEFPSVNYQNATSTDNILMYALIANKHFKPTGSVDITGNAYIGGDNTDNEKNPAADINGSTITFKANGTQETNIISGGNVRLTQNASLTAENVALWADSIVLENSKLNPNLPNESNPKLSSYYIKNDLVLGNGGIANMAGKLIMFGNPWVAISDEMINSAEVRQAAAANMPEYSSSILVTGSKAGVDLSKLNTMVIGGSAYIDSEKYNGTKNRKEKTLDYKENKIIRDSTIVGNDNVVTGQSLALKSDQRAYLVPATLVGVKDNGTGYKNGLTNPMTGEQYEALQEEIMKEKGYTRKSQIQDSDYVNYDIAEPTIGMSVNGFAMAHNPSMTVEQWKDYLPGVKVCAYPTTNGGTIVYLFIEFKTVGDNFSGQQNTSYIPAEAFYNNWYKLYNSTLTNYTRLLGNLEYYTPYGIKLPKDVNDKTRMYFTGNILSTETNPVIIPDIITQPDFTIDLNVEYSKQSAYYQDAYYTLNKNLSTRYSTLSALEKTRDLFSNIILKDDITSTKYYVSTSGDAAVVHRGDYTYDNRSENSVKSVSDNFGDTHDDAKINVIIATGDVTVKENFVGMIIAGGDVKVESGCNVTSASDKAARALTATSYEDGADSTDCAANYVVDAARYLLGGTGRTDEDSGAITMKDYVTFRNWTRQ